MQLKSLHIVRNTYAFTNDGIPAGELGGHVELESPLGTIRTTISPALLAAILATVATDVARAAQAMAGGVSAAGIRNSGGLALEHAETFDPPTFIDAPPAVELAENGAPVEPLEFAVGAVYATRDGRQARILEIVASGAEISMSDSYRMRVAIDGVTEFYTAAGGYYASGEESELDLVARLPDDARTDVAEDIGF